MRYKTYFMATLLMIFIGLVACSSEEPASLENTGEQSAPETPSTTGIADAEQIEDDQSKADETAEAVGGGLETAGEATGSALQTAGEATEKGVKTAAGATEEGIKTAASATEKGVKAGVDTTVDVAKKVGEATKNAVEEVGKAFEGDKKKEEEKPDKP